MKIAVVTGGASGIGRATAHVLRRDGYMVWVADINLESSKSVAGKVEGEAFYLDVSDENSIQDLVATAASRDIVPHVLVNCAGIIQAAVTPDQLPQEDWDRVTNIDWRGTYICCREFGGKMAEAGRGAIVSIASIAAMRSVPLHAYGPAKAAVVAMTQNMASEWGRSGVRVNSVSPGFTLSPPIIEAIKSGARSEEALASQSAMGRLVKPEEVANTIAFLCSDKASAITGVNLPVDAGWLVAGSWETYGGVPAPTM